MASTGNEKIRKKKFATMYQNGAIALKRLKLEKL